MLYGRPQAASKSRPRSRVDISHVCCLTHNRSLLSFDNRWGLSTKSCSFTLKSIGCQGEQWWNDFFYEFFKISTCTFLCSANKMSLLTYAMGIFGKLNELNMNTQGEKKITLQMNDQINAFKRKIAFWNKDYIIFLFVWCQSTASISVSEQIMAHQ